MNAHEILHDLVNLSNEADVCTCASLPHVTSTAEYFEAIQDVLTMLEAAVRFSHDEEALRANVGHVLNVVVALGYAIGAGDAFDSGDVAVNIPATLAAIDWLGDAGESESE